MSKNRKAGQRALKIGSSNGFWMRVYHRNDKTCYLCNFCPMGCNGFLPQLERLLCIEEVAMFREVDMAFIITKKGRGVPVVDLTEFLNSINFSENKKEITREAYILSQTSLEMSEIDKHPKDMCYVGISNNIENSNEITSKP